MGYLTDHLYEAVPAGVKSILVHALNPHGFAQLRRVNEDNVDLNRNFQDFTKPLPDPSAYEELHDILVPSEWEGPIRQAANAALMQYIQLRGQATFQAATLGGQYSPDRVVLRWREGNAVQPDAPPDPPRTPRRNDAMTVLDLHTGLGPTGYGEPIYIGPEDDGFRRAQKWYGSDVTSTNKGTSVSASRDRLTTGRLQ